MDVELSSWTMCVVLCLMRVVTHNFNALRPDALQVLKGATALVLTLGTMHCDAALARRLTSARSESAHERDGDQSDGAAREIKDTSEALSFVVEFDAPGIT
jgi:hypothetical protein